MGALRHDVLRECGLAVRPASSEFVRTRLGRFRIAFTGTRLVGCQNRARAAQGLVLAPYQYKSRPTKSQLDINET